MKNFLFMLAFAFITIPAHADLLKEVVDAQNAQPQDVQRTKQASNVDYKKVYELNENILKNPMSNKAVEQVMYKKLQQQQATTNTTTSTVQCNGAVTGLYIKCK